MSKAEKELFEQYLEKHGMRMSGKRALILDAFLAKEGHFTTKEFLAYIKTIDSSIGQATVYRNLKHLASAGLARELDFGNGSKIYEHKHGHDHHDHIVCTARSKRAEVYNGRIETLQEKMAQEHGYKLTSHKLYLHGLCPECR
jgi:Fur family ferric uptake transcriptional regulator